MFLIAGIVFYFKMRNMRKDKKNRKISTTELMTRPFDVPYKTATGFDTVYDHTAILSYGY